MRLGFSWLALGSVVLVGLLSVVLWRGGVQRAADVEGTTLHLYCAAGVRRPVQDVIDRYRDEYGVAVETTYGGSGKLLALVEAGERGDLYLAADQSYLDTGARKQLLFESVGLAKQRPCVVVRRDTTVQLESLGDLFRGDVKTSLANPDVAAVGRVARRLLDGIEHDGRPVWESIFEAATVTRQTVNEVANDVKSGVVDAGIVWDATADQYKDLVIVPIAEFPEDKSQRISVGVLSTATEPARALHFLRFLAATDRGLESFADHGYDVLAGDRWAERPEVQLFTGGLMHPAIQNTIVEFEKREGVTVIQTRNGCGILVSQIRAGEHPDVYFACDLSFMTKVQDVFPNWQDLSGTEMVIVVGKQPQQKLGIKTIDDLATKSLKLGLCNPEHSALGELTRQLITKAGRWEKIQPKVVDWPSTADRLVESVVIGGLDAAIVYRANTTLQADKLVVIEIDDPGASAVQPVAVSRDSEFPELSSRLVKRLRSAESRLQFESRGFRWLGEQQASGAIGE